MERTHKIPLLFNNSYNHDVYGSDLQTVQRCWVKRSCHTIRFAVDQALSGKIYNRGVRVYKLTMKPCFLCFCMPWKISTKMIARIATLSKMVKLEWKTLLKTYQRSNLIDSANQRSSRHFTTYSWTTWNILK